MDASISDLVAATLSELGLPAPTNLIQTTLMHDGYFAGWKFRYDGGYAILPAGGGTIEFYDGQGTLLKTVALETDREAAELNGPGCSDEVSKVGNARLAFTASLLMLQVQKATARSLYKRPFIFMGP